MICGGSRTCGCSFQSESLQISNNNGLVTLETFGPAVVTSATRPASPFTWQHIFESDTGLSWVWDGSDWVLQSWIVAPACELRVSTPFSVPFGSNTAWVTYDIEDHDPFGWHSAGNPTRITPTIPGVFQMWCGGLWQADTDYNRVQNAAYLNGALLDPWLVDDSYIPGTSATPAHYSVFDGIELNGTTDYLEHRGWQSNASSDTRTFDARCIVRWMRNL